MPKLILRKKDNNFSVSFFDCESKDGKKYTGVMLSRGFKDKSGEWKNEDLHIFTDDLLKIANLCTRSYEAVKEIKEVAPPKEKQEEQVDDLDDAIPF